MGCSKGIEFSDATVSFGEGLFELLDGAAMGGFPIAQFDFELMHAILGRLEFLDLGAQAVLVSQAFIQLSDLFTEDTDLFLQDVASLLGGSTGLQGISNFVRLRGRNCIKFFDATVSFGEGPFELLDGAAMSGFPIAQFDLQLVDTTAHRLQLFDLGAKAFSGWEPFIELGDLVTEDAYFFLQDFASLLGRLAG